MLKLKKLSLLIFALLTMLLSSCNKYYTTEYTYIPPESNQDRDCIIACRHKMESCEKSANKSYQECLRAAQKSSMFNYEIDLDNKDIHKAENAYYKPMQCQSVNNTCVTEYNNCYRSCGGIVEPNTRSVN